VIVVDASVLAPVLAADDAQGDRFRTRLRGHKLAAPVLVDLEVMSVLRHALLAGKLDQRRAALALKDLVDLPIHRAVHLPLLPRAWALRGNLTPYDAAYVALAESLGAVLVTADARLARASGPQCPIEVMS